MRSIFLNKTIIQRFNKMNPSGIGRRPLSDIYKSVVEGRAILRLMSKDVFYNPVQEFNRDISIAVLSVFTDDYRKHKLMQTERKRMLENNPVQTHNDHKNENINVTVLEAFSATGLRSIRYAKEVVNLTKIIANDYSTSAVETMKDNIEFNNVDHIVETNLDDARTLMYEHRDPSKHFAAIDLDPYGCPSTFLDAAVQSVADGGLLLVTATDMAVLAGNCPESCYCKYGAISLKIKCCHEMALRILLQSIQTHANRYGRYIEPLLSISADFYIRVFVKVKCGPMYCKKSTSKLSMVYRCVGCDTFILHPLGAFKPNPTPKKPDQLKSFLPTGPPVGQKCDNCNQKYQLGGPIWSAPIHDESFVSRVLCAVEQNAERFGTARRLLGVLSVVCEELADAPLYYTLDRLCGAVHSPTIPMLLLRSAIMNSGYRVSYSHANKLSIKTNAPSTLIWDIMRAWAMQSVSSTKARTDPVAGYILSKRLTYDVDLMERGDANPMSRMMGHRRYQANPAPHWGPGTKYTINDNENNTLKSIRNQNKYTTKVKKHMHLKYQKRRHSPQEDEEGCKRVVIDYSSDDGKTEGPVSDEPDSDAAIDDKDKVTVAPSENLGSEAVEAPVNAEGTKDALPKQLEQSEKLTENKN